MRSRIAGAILIGAASVAAANAADISAGFSVSGSNGVYSSYVARMEPVIVFNFESGVTGIPPGEIATIFRVLESGQGSADAKSCPSTACQNRKSIFASGRLLVSFRFVGQVCGANGVRVRAAIGPCFGWSHPRRKCRLTTYSPSAAAFETFKLFIWPGRSMRAR